MASAEETLSEYIKEQSRLKRLINKAVATSEFKIAHFHSKALRRIEERIRILRRLEDKFTQDIMSVKNQIKFLEDSMNQDFRPERDDYLIRTINKLQNKLLELERKQAEHVEFTADLPALLESLINRKICSIRIIGIKTSDFTLEIKRSRQGIKIKIPDLHTLLRQGLIYESHLKHFNAIGFKASPNGKILSQTFNDQNNRAELINKIEITIAKIVFEIFPWRTFDAETLIEIRE